MAEGRALAQLDDPRPVGDAAVLVEEDAGRAPVWGAPARADAVMCASDAPAPDLAAVQDRLALLGPLGGLLDSDEALFDADGVIEELVAGGLRPHLQDVPEPEVNWVHAQLAGQPVHLALGGEVESQIPEAPEAASEHLVGVDRPAIDRGIGDLVRPGCVGRLPPEPEGGPVGVGAALQCDVHLYACELPLLVRP